MNFQKINNYIKNILLIFILIFYSCFVFLYFTSNFREGIDITGPEGKLINITKSCTDPNLPEVKYNGIVKNPEIILNNKYDNLITIDSLNPGQSPYSFDTSSTTTGGNIDCNSIFNNVKDHLYRYTYSDHNNNTNTNISGYFFGDNNLNGNTYIQVINIDDDSIYLESAKIFFGKATDHFNYINSNLTQHKSFENNILSKGENDLILGLNSLEKIVNQDTLKANYNLYLNTKSLHDKVIAAIETEKARIAAAEKAAAEKAAADKAAADKAAADDATKKADADKADASKNVVYSTPYYSVSKKAALYKQQVNTYTVDQNTCEIIENKNLQFSHVGGLLRKKKYGGYDYNGWGYRVRNDTNPRTKWKPKYDLGCSLKKTGKNYDPGEYGW